MGDPERVPAVTMGDPERVPQTPPNPPMLDGTLRGSPKPPGYLSARLCLPARGSVRQARRGVRSRVVPLPGEGSAMADAGGGDHAGQAGGPPQGASARWALIALLPPVLCLLLSSVYVVRWSSEIDQAVVSVSTNGGPSVVYLAAEAEYLRRIALRVMAARPETVDDDRVAVAAWKAGLTTAENAERLTPEYPGERWAYYVVHADRARFLATVSVVLDTLDTGHTPPAALYARLSSSADLVSRLPEPAHRGQLRRVAVAIGAHHRPAPAPHPGDGSRP